MNSKRKSKTVLGSHKRAAEALEGLYWVLGHAPNTYGTPVPDSSVRVAFLSLEEGHFSVFYRQEEKKATLLSIRPVEAEDLG